MVDTMVHPGDALWVAVAVAGKLWPSPGQVCMLPALPASDLQVSGGFGLLGDEERFMPSLGCWSA